jgi:cyclopropane-fatty-acyl-phospholipid synthase
MTVHDPRLGRQRAMVQRATTRMGNAFWKRIPSRLFDSVLRRVDQGLVCGSLELHLPDGSVRLLGGRSQGFSAIVHLANWRAIVRLASSGSVGWYRAWRSGDWSSPDPVSLFALFGANARSLGNAARSQGWRRVAETLGHGLRRNSLRGSRRNIADHYDLGNDFYSLWLDRTLTYSCARPTHPDDDLEAAQYRKIDELIARLNLKSGSQILEIGCGWGSVAERTLAGSKVEYTGLTLSREQKELVSSRLTEAGFEARARVLLQDYRNCSGQFDAIVSVEMVEAVGRPYWAAYLQTIHRLLRPGGRAAVQFISIDDDVFPAYAARADFIQKYIFLGGCLIAERSFRKIAEGCGLEWIDQTRFGMDYAWTLRQWRGRFDRMVENGLLPPRFDQRFVDLWRYYLIYCEGGFLGRSIDVSQVTLVKPGA